MPHPETAVVDRRADMATFKKEVRNDLADMRKTVEKAHDETISSRASVNANSEHLIKMCDLITVQYRHIAKGMEENTALTKTAAETAQKAYEMAQKTAKDTAGIVKFYNIGDTAVSVVAQVPGKVSRFSKAAYPVIAVVALGVALWDKGLSGAAKILEVFK